MKDISIELVVAHYHENLNWLKRVPCTIQKTIYSKAEAPLLLPHHILSNVGREAHSYLHHLVTRYHSLADYTVFCQGKPFDHAYDFHATLRKLAAGEFSDQSFVWLGHIIDTDTPDGLLFRQWSKNKVGDELDLAGLHQNLFGTSGPDSYPFVLGAQLIVSRKLVHAQPLPFYQKAFKLTTTFPNAAHGYERMWDRVFNVEGIDRKWLANRKTVYLKPIKRLG
ncbi:DUF3431 domain-containing protein [Salmonirosea aquatica]|uniref:DUF3431 domain-containing protein n=1 Tax=Salmonirosea aquatica TaxID=2654236 RepID=A0A7C9BSM1_9BACT|nr:DUF3431 domain-containing protein [Cytophagaceae bacterium SJW1-29]